MPLAIPTSIADVDALETALSDPPDCVVDALARLEGDLMVLGAGGKMGPTLARMAMRARQTARMPGHVICVSRFSDQSIQQKLEQQGMRTIRGDLLSASFVDSLPNVPNIVYMTGLKFGATGNEPLVWAMNAVAPSLVCRKFDESRIAAFSTGNVYGPVPLSSGGSTEGDPLNPVGEYAMSCVGRERVFQHYSNVRGTPIVLLRLNYAVEPRYGVLVDLANKVKNGEPIDLAVSHANVIWQQAANAYALCALADADAPAKPLNIAGETLFRVQDVCQQFGELFGCTPVFKGKEMDESLLSNGTACRNRYGDLDLPLESLVQLTADWLKRGMDTLNKPTHFEVSDGKF